MLTENFIGWFLRRKTSSYFKFEDIGKVNPPQPTGKPMHLYIHIPFCTELCPYCSFHRVKFNEELTRKYFSALRKELHIYKELGFDFNGVYIGGGTPTVLMDELLDTLELIGKLFSARDISIETNPDRLNRETMQSLVAMNVKRVSVGIQTFDDGMLKSIGRYHKYGSSDVLRQRLMDTMGIVDTLNADMIFNFPVQDHSMLENDLRILEEISPDQITYYPLMISDATRKKMEGIMGPHSFAKEKQFYDLISNTLENNYVPTSAWCFSRRDSSMIDEYIVANNEYVGVGSGAFGLVNDAIYANTFSIPDYIEELENGRLPLSSKNEFSAREMARYVFLMELFGLDMKKSRFNELTGHELLGILGPECLFFWMAGGLKISGNEVSLTRRGRYFWVIMMREFFTGVDNFRDLSREAVGIKI